MTPTGSLNSLSVSVLLIGSTQQKETKKEADKPVVPVVQLIRQDAMNTPGRTRRI